MKYLIKFEKKNMMIYISHLDTQRLFHRTMKRARLDLKYSTGFNPHPKLSFAQPLSLGHSSVSEYAEFETQEIRLQPHEVKERLNKMLPDGFKVVEAWILPQDSKSAAAQVAAAKYHIEIPFFFSYMSAIMEFFENESIIVNKRNKKNGSVESKNIRPQIISLKPVMVDNSNIMLTTSLHCGSASNLNPEVMLESFYKCSRKAYDRNAVKIERVAILGWNNEELLPLEYICKGDF
ncbi:MAG: TIGR03936 family radical SAM-associated protein [Clostridiales Family XIII bacterium]|jgi:radical SAM-linked protein|nr:TIGR03936 family radical SAM-associated protein [Clostridiales Family XIII bacterium]